MDHGFSNDQINIQLYSLCAHLAVHRRKMDDASLRAVMSKLRPWLKSTPQHMDKNIAYKVFRPALVELTEWIDEEEDSTSKTSHDEVRVEEVEDNDHVPRSTDQSPARSHHSHEERHNSEDKGSDSRDSTHYSMLDEELDEDLLNDIMSEERPLKRARVEISSCCWLCILN